MERIVKPKNANGKISLYIWITVLVILFGAGLVTGFLSAPKHYEPTGPFAQIEFLRGDLGGGVLISYSHANHKFVLIDPGSSEYADALISFLGNRKAENLTVFLCDTARSAYGAVDSLVDTFAISQIIIPENTPGDQSWQNSLKRIRERQIKIIRVSDGDSIILTENSAMQILSPIKMQNNLNASQKLVGRLVFGETSFIFASMLDPNDEVVLVKSNHLLPSNVLHISTKSYNSSSLEFISEVRPELSVYSEMTGKRSATTALLQRVNPINTGAELLQSTQTNSVVMRTDGNEVTVHE